MPEHPRRIRSARAAGRANRAATAAGADQSSINQAIRQWLAAIVWAVILIPLIFYLKFGEVGPLGWGLTIFVVVLSLLSAIGLFYLRRPEYHTPVAQRGDWLDRIGAFWLIACAFGPLFGWILTAAFPVTLASWRWLYGGRICLSIALPILTAIPLVRYARGRGAPLMMALLIGVTALPIWSGWANWQDLQAAPLVRQSEQGKPVWYLPHTGRTLDPP